MVVALVVVEFPSITRPVEVASWAVKFWRVVEPLASKSVMMSGVGSESVQVLLAVKSCAPAEEVIWLAVPAMVIVLEEGVMVESTSEEVTVAQVATPKADKARTNWLVQVVPVYSANSPTVFVRRSAEVKGVIAKLLVTAKLVDDPLVKRVVARVVEPVLVEEAVESQPL